MTDSRPEHGSGAYVQESKRTHAKDTASPALREDNSPAPGSRPYIDYESEFRQRNDDRTHRNRLSVLGGDPQNI